jgi:hypothetical protein
VVEKSAASDFLNDNFFIKEDLINNNKSEQEWAYPYFLIKQQLITREEVLREKICLKAG